MYSRKIVAPQEGSFFLLGPRGTGKSSWVRTQFKGAAYVDLLDADIYTDLLSSPKRLSRYIGENREAIIDEVQKIPAQRAICLS